MQNQIANHKPIGLGKLSILNFLKSYRPDQNFQLLNYLEKLK